MKFNNLPLIRVEAKLSFRSVVHLTPWNAVEIARLLRPQYDTIRTDYMPQAIPGVAPIQRLPNTLEYIAFRQSDSGMGAVVHTQFVSSAWDKQQDSDRYPGFSEIEASLDQLLTLLSDGGDMPPLVAVQLCYTVMPDHQDEGDPVWFLSSSEFGPAVRRTGQVHQLTFHRSDGPVENTVIVSMDKFPGDDRTSCGVATLNGTKVEEGDWKQALRSCHDSGIEFFREIISQEAMKLWEYLD